MILNFGQISETISPVEGAAQTIIAVAMDPVNDIIYYADIVSFGVHRMNLLGLNDVFPFLSLSPIVPLSYFSHFSLLIILSPSSLSLPLTFSLPSTSSPSPLSLLPSLTLSFTDQTDTHILYQHPTAITSLAVDFESQNLYFIDSHERRLEVVS